MRIKTIVLCVIAAFAAGPNLSTAQAPVVPTAKFAVPVALPTVDGVRPLETKTIDALKGDGIFYFSGVRSVNLRAEDRPHGDRYTLTETSTDIGVRAFYANVDVQNFVRDGVRRPVGAPGFATPAADGGARLVYAGTNPLHVSLHLKAYEVSGLRVAEFLRTADGRPSPEALKLGEAVFPPGSIAYLADARFDDDVLMLPRRESFTGAANTRQMIANFSKDNPFCLSYEDRDGAKPYALHFRGSGTKGKTELYPAKTGTMFCARGTEKPVAEGVWEERVVGGTRAIVLSFGADVDPLDTGLTQNERDAALIAFIEPTKGTPGVRPGKLYRAGSHIADHEFRFNHVAATAIQTALGVL